MIITHAYPDQANKEELLATLERYVLQVQTNYSTLYNYNRV